MTDKNQALGAPVDLVLGPLPDAATKGTFPGPHGYSCEQMRAYAAEQVAAERQRWILKAGATYADAHAIFNDPPSCTSQEVRDVIEWHHAAMRANEDW